MLAGAVRREDAPTDRDPLGQRNAAMYVGFGIFALIAVLCVVAYFKVRDREKEWEQEEHRQGRD